MLIGDAAACVNPLNGEGIDYGLETGRLAAQMLDSGGLDRGGLDCTESATTPTAAAAGAIPPVTAVSAAVIALLVNTPGGHCTSRTRLTSSHTAATKGP
jgi:hypothetical protein